MFCIINNNQNVPQRYSNAPSHPTRYGRGFRPILFPFHRRS